MAMTTFYEFMQGRVKYAHLSQPDLQYNNWNVVIYPTNESYEKLLKLKEGKEGVDGILNAIGKDEDGYYVTFKRPCSKPIRGKLTAFSPPIVMEKDGKTPLQEMVGIGSDITAKIEVYQYKKPMGGRGSAARLVSVRVDNLVPYTRDNDFDAEQEKQVKGLEDQPEQLF